MAGAGGAPTHPAPGAPEASIGDFPPRELVRLLRSLSQELDMKVPCAWFYARALPPADPPATRFCLIFLCPTKFRLARERERWS